MFCPQVRVHPVSPAHPGLWPLTLPRVVAKPLSAATPQIVKMPTEQETINNASEFAKYGDRNVPGAIAGTAISISVPASNEHDCFTGKYTTAINLAVCNARKEFLVISKIQCEVPWFACFPMFNYPKNSHEWVYTETISSSR